MTELTHFSLFSGIGGIDLAAEWASFRTVGMCERDPYCSRVLAKHWPDVPVWEDVRDVTRESLHAAGIAGINLLSGGFPCQDISGAGKKVGIQGARSGLWSEMYRIIGEVRPGYVLVENVAELLIRGLTRVLGDLASIGYDAEWSVVSACAVGAPHARERLFIVAYPERKPGTPSGVLGRGGASFGPGHQATEERREGRIRPQVGTATPGLPHPWQEAVRESSILRMVDGVPAELDRLRVLGNAVVPQQVYPILKAIAEIEGSR